MPILSSLSNRRVSALLGFLIGAIAWSGHLYALPCVLALPLVLSACPTFRDRLTVAAAYNAGAIWPILIGAPVFFGAQFRPLDTLTLYAVSTILLTLPWLAIAGRSRYFWWGIPLATLISALLPTGVVNPLTAAGVLFPGASFAGLLLLTATFGLLPIYPKHTLSAVVALSIVFNLARPALHPPAAWEGVNTHSGSAPGRQTRGLTEYTQAVEIQRQALTSSARILIYPESAVYRWNASTEVFWSDTLATLKANNRSIVFGAGRSLSGSAESLNVLEVRGMDVTEYAQHIPIPHAMWRPYGRDGVPLRTSGPYTFVLDKQRVAPLICYEQLVVAPVVRAMLDRPTVILATSNLYWASRTPIPAIQHSSVEAWSRLFSVPFIEAINQ